LTDVTKKSRRPSAEGRRRSSRLRPEFASAGRTPRRYPAKGTRTLTRRILTDRPTVLGPRLNRERADHIAIRERVKLEKKTPTPRDRASASGVVRATAGGVGGRVGPRIDPAAGVPGGRAPVRSGPRVPPSRPDSRMRRMRSSMLARIAPFALRARRRRQPRFDRPEASASPAASGLGVEVRTALADRPPPHPLGRRRDRQAGPEPIPQRPGEVRGLGRQRGIFRRRVVRIGQDPNVGRIMVRAGGVDQLAEPRVRLAAASAFGQRAGLATHGGSHLVTTNLVYPNDDNAGQDVGLNSSISGSQDFAVSDNPGETPEVEQGVANPVGQDPPLYWFKTAPRAPLKHDRVNVI